MLTSVRQYCEVNFDAVSNVVDEFVIKNPAVTQGARGVSVVKGETYTCNVC